MTARRLVLLCGSALLALAQPAWGQPRMPSGSWRAYKLADGLPESACIEVTIAPQGKVLARHLATESVSELDGYGINVMPSPPTGNSRVYGSPAGQLWTVGPEGLQEFRNGGWLPHPVPEIAVAFRTGLPHLSDPIPLCPVRQGLMIVLLPDRLLQLDSEDAEHLRTKVLLSAAQTGLERLTGMTQPASREGGLWIAGTRGLIKLPGPVRSLRPDSDRQQFLIPATLAIENLAEPRDDGDGGVTALAESSESHQKLIVRFDGHEGWATKPIGVEKVRHGWRGPDQTWWAATIDSLFKWEENRPEWIESEEIAARQYFDVAVEPSGAFWLATSEGLFRYAPLSWRTPKSVEKLGALVHGLTADQEGRLWFISGGALHAVQDDRHQEFAFPPALARKLQSAHALFALGQGTLVLAVEDQLVTFHSETGAFETVPRKLSGLKALGLMKDGKLCVQTADASAVEPTYRLETYDGRTFEPLTGPLASSPLDGGALALLEGQNGDLWLGGPQGTAWYHDKKWRSFPSADKTAPEAVLSFVELPDGRVWCATPDKIWEFDGRNWSVARGGFDRINGLRRTRDGSVWVASNNGLHHFIQGALVEKGAWVENGLEEGLPAASVRQVYEDPRGRLWAATTHGLSLYHPETDLDPPHTHIQNLSQRERNVPEGSTVNLSFSGQDKWNHTPRHRLLYSYRLDERDWSPFQEANAVPFPDLLPGKHYFQVRAMDRNGNVDPNPDQLNFAVVLPWYKETRLVLISLAGLTAALFFAGLAFNRHRHLLRSYAEVEDKVAQRTQELDVANRELLHSQKMNALGTLAAGIAHDFNNILSIVKGSAQIIEDNLDNPQKVRLRVDRIKTVVEQGSGIVKAMLGFTRDSEQPSALCDVNGAVTDTLKLLGDRFQREVQVSFEPAPALPEVPGSKDFIQQILLNFIFNAAEAMPGRKQVIVGTNRLDHLSDGLVLKPASAEGYVAISVRDFGCGISAENLPRIFEPFFTTKALSARRGTGLGLSMVYELAKKMEAGLSVESVVDQGSTFTLILPVRNSSPNSH